ncbi:MAG: undecaprenyl/decaprenyl-phosphate alpha-N-acetylglucosaminyl 1-phosphate transferase [Ferruginibacter sp.]|nr:undecaprenyl/decaprenyl-phosphate alpha-N-acetylglucosaminyl 1-phosphate transferase [Bacteroidota bacterium]MBX2917711.1 undecaprenyl/decaprenyl-phosphate alpha-N-acetylglucosaminyl 1-phosphate transferase [Ferruginibacter sp.]MCB0707866.1 undecaprenyl/decaprenyl-phosphate alpha-N-acetylglucosaminyl 1-phosphate transferase [Chitinophagaceae bacterium]
MDNILLSATLAFLITFFAIPVIIQVAKDKKLFDEPDERKVHKNVIPTLGGLGIFAGFIIATLMGVPSGITSELQYFAAAATVIFFLGIKDDILILSASKKFIGQLIAAGIIIKFGGVQISNMHGFLGINEIPHIASIVISIFTIIVITNSFNLIDGVDGLAGSLGLLTTLVFGVYFFYVGQLTYAVIALALSGSIIGFLIYNFSPAKIFMGDTGSLLIGLINSILVIKFINVAGNPASNLPIEAAPAIGFSILMIPLFDTLRVFGLRILDRRSPFSPDRNHVHHFLLDLGLSHRMVTLTCVSVNILFICLAFFLRHLGTTTVIGILLCSAFVFIGAIYYNRPKNRNVANMKVENADIIKTHKLLKLAGEPVEAE